MNDPIVLVEISYYEPGVGVGVLRFCDGLAYRLRPTEGPANALYRPFLTDPGWCRVDVFNKPGQYGHVTPGEVRLNDASGVLGRQLIRYAFDGRSVVIRIGERGAPYPSGYVTVINGTLDGQPSYAWGEITFRPADLTAAQAKALLSARYAGTNVLPNGLEGVDDLKGKIKPLVLALASNMSPVLVNTARLIYQVSIPTGAAAVGVSAVRDRGVPLTPGAAYATLADLQATAPAAGTYRVFSSVSDGCFVRVGISPAGALTVDAAYGAAADRTHGQVWRRILSYGGVPSSSISTADVATLDAALSAQIEYALFDETNIDAALTAVAASAGAAWYGDPAGVYRLTQWQVPAGAPVATLTELRTDTMGISDPVGSGDVAPAYRVVLEFGRNWTVQADASIGGDKTSATDPVRAPGARAGLAARAWLSMENRTVESADDTVKVAYLNAIELKLTSLITDQAAAQAYANQQLALYKVARHMTTLAQWLSPTQIDTIRAGAVVMVYGSRWGYDSGRLMRVAGVQVDRMTKKTELTCWG